MARSTSVWPVAFQASRSTIQPKLARTWSSQPKPIGPELGSQSRRLLSSALSCVV